MSTLKEIEFNINKLLPHIVRHVSDKSVEKVQENIDKYYGEWTPPATRGHYDRINAFKDQTLTADSVNISGNNSIITLAATEHESNIKGWKGSSSPEDILHYNMHGFHGGAHTGEDVWENSLRSIDAYIDIWVSEALNAKGVPHRNRY